MGLKDRIREAIDSSGIRKSHIAKEIGISPSAITQWINGETKKIDSNNLVRLAGIAKVNPVWLATGKGEAQNFTQAPDVRDYVPLISMVQAGAFCEAMDNLAVGDSVEMVPAMYPKKRHTFALEVQGDSMLPTFPPGMRLIVEPDMEYRSGDFVIAKNGGDATFKQIVKDGGVWYLKPLNAQFPTLPLADAHVIGVVRNAVITFR
ncbi:MAG: XRE family transcriptional regulator [Gallionella sp.]|nr:XRE family transcriptional regulator [Gallionella sp.]MDP1941264.1 XRE family transcriptional regulator [Gallionella sp.]